MKNFFKTKYGQVSTIAAGTLAAGVASADTVTDITAAFTAGQANVTAVATGVIALAAIMTGVGLVARWLSK